MNSHLIQFKNKNNPNEKTEKIQIDDSTDVIALSSILSTLLSKETNFFFYFQNQRITCDISSIISKHKLSLEETIEIEYIDEEDFKADSVKECNDVVIQMSYFDGKIFYLTFSGNIFSFDSNKALGNSKKGIFSHFSYDEYCLYNLEDDSLIHRFDKKIQTGYCFDRNIVIATDNSIYLGNNDGFISIKDHSTFIRSPKINDENIYWIEDYNKLVIYNLSKSEFSTITSEYSLNNIVLSNSKVYISTANNKILEIYQNNVKEYDIKSRFSNCILSIGSNIIYTTQNEIISCSLDSFELLEKHFHKTHGQIHSIETDGKHIYVANDNIISVFLRSTLKV